MFVITLDDDNPAIEGALRNRGTVTLYPDAKLAGDDRKLLLNREDQKRYTVKPIEVKDAK